MRRRNQQLRPVTFEEFERKVELLQLARQYAEGFSDGSSRKEGAPHLSKTATVFHSAVRCNGRGTDHLKKQQQQESGSSAGNDAEKTAAAKAAAATWRAALQQHPERCNLFELMPAFPSAAQCLEYMEKSYGFFVSLADASVVILMITFCLFLGHFSSCLADFEAATAPCASA